MLYLYYLNCIYFLIRAKFRHGYVIREESLKCYWGVSLPFMVTQAFVSCNRAQTNSANFVHEKANTCTSRLKYSRLRRRFAFVEGKKCLGTLNEGEWFFVWENINYFAECGLRPSSLRAIFVTVWTDFNLQPSLRTSSNDKQSSNINCTKTLKQDHSCSRSLMC